MRSIFELNVKFHIELDVKLFFAEHKNQTKHQVSK